MFDGNRVQNTVFGCKMLHDSHKQAKERDFSREKQLAYRREVLRKIIVVEHISD